MSHDKQHDNNIVTIKYIENKIITAIKNDMPKAWNKCLIEDIEPFSKSGLGKPSEFTDKWLLHDRVLDYQIKNYLKIRILIAELKTKILHDKGRMFDRVFIIATSNQQWRFAYHSQTWWFRAYHEYVFPTYLEIARLLGMQVSSVHADVFYLKQYIDELEVKDDKSARQKIESPTAFDVQLEMLPLDYRFFYRDYGERNYTHLYLGADKAVWEHWRYRPKSVYALRNTPDSVTLFLGDQYTELAEAFSRSTHAKKISKMTVGNVSGSGVSESLEVASVIMALSKGQFPSLESLHLGLFEMVFNGDLMGLELGDVTKLVESCQNIKELEIEGYFSLKNSLRLEKLEHLSILLEDLHSFGPKDTVVVLDNMKTVEFLLNSDFPNLKVVDIDVEYCSGFSFSFCYELSDGESYATLAKPKITELKNEIKKWLKESLGVFD